MEQNIRPQRRTKNKPQEDLRKKVLLKNFLREQMSPSLGPITSNSTTLNKPEDSNILVNDSIENITEAEIEVKDSENLYSVENAPHSTIDPKIESKIDTKSVSFINSADDGPINPPLKPHSNSPWRSSIVFDFAKVTEFKLSRFNNLKRKSPTLTTEEAKAIAGKNSKHFDQKNQSEKELAKNEERNKTARHKLSKFLSPWRRKENNDPGKLVGITKAKNKIKSSNFLGSQENKPSKFKVKIKNAMSEFSDAVSKRKRSILEPKSKYLERILPYPDPILYESRKANSLDNKCHFEATESKICGKRKVDMSWSLIEIRKLEKANKLLREENEMLSQSLSSIMADVDAAFNTFHPQPVFYDNNLNKLNNMPINRHSTSRFSDPKCKVLRSRSVYYQSERRREIKSRLSSQSMRYPQYSRIPPRPLYRAKPCVINPEPSERSPYPVSPTLSSSLDRNSGQSSSRRSYMPEKNQLRPSINRRSSFENRSLSRNLLSLPTDAFY